MGKSRDDESYAQGAKDGQSADFVDQVANSLSKGFHATESGRRDDEIYQKGYDFGVSHPESSSDSSSSSGSSDGCFVSTACVYARGLPDDCHELSVLRAFRDRYVSGHSGGPELIARYYANAPRLLASIKARSDAKEILQALYFDLVVPSVALLEAAKPKDALDLYIAKVTELERRYLIDAEA